MSYVDGFVIPIKKKNLKAYWKIARLAGKVWRDHGALEYRECAGDQLRIHGVAPFEKMARLKAGETAVFSWIVYKSKADRDRINKAVMEDKRLASMMDPKAMPFDMKRFAYGGFKLVVDA